MPELNIFLFGDVHLSRPTLPGRVPVPRSVRGLLGYLLINRNRFHARETLAGLLWGESDDVSARNNLNTALWRLRQVLEPSTVARGTFLTASNTGDIGFNADSDYWLDAEELEARTRGLLRGRPDTVTVVEVAALQDCVKLYRGDLLEACYEDWATHERERLRELFLDGLHFLMRYHELASEYGRSLEIGREMLRHDTLREEVHRCLMRLYVKNGERALAVRQFEQCRRVLRLELDIDPMPETVALHAAIVAGRPLADCAGCLGPLAARSGERPVSTA